MDKGGKVEVFCSVYTLHFSACEANRNRGGDTCAAGTCDDTCCTDPLKSCTTITNDGGTRIIGCEVGSVLQLCLVIESPFAFSFFSVASQGLFIYLKKM